MPVSVHVCTQSIGTCNGTVWCEHACAGGKARLSLRLPRWPSTLTGVAGRPRLEGQVALPLWGWGTAGPQGWGGARWDSPPRSCWGDPRRAEAYGGARVWELGPPGALVLSWWSRERGSAPEGQGGASRPPLDPCPTHPTCLQALTASEGIWLAYVCVAYAWP